MGDKLDTINLGLEVPIGSIEKELKKLWQADEARTNASLMNFVIFSEEEGVLEQNSQIMRELTEEHACRGILVNLIRSAEEITSRAWITTHCHLANGQKSICCEQIAFLLKGYTIGRLRNVIFAHASSDLPLTLWWQGDLSDLFFERFYSMIDRFIFDSSQWTEPKNQFAMVQDALDHSTNNLVVQDLSWTRTYHFRLAIAALFDEPCTQSATQSLQQVTIKARSQYRASALMLIAWVFTQLKGILETDSQNSLTYRLESGQLVKVDLHFDDKSAVIGELTLRAEGFVASVIRDAEAPTLRQTLTVDDTIVVDRLSPSDADSSQSLVADQLSRGGKNALFKKVLPAFYKLV